MRPEEVALQRTTKRWLRMIARARSTEAKPVPPDQVADELLQDSIRAKFPSLVEIDGEYVDLEKRMIAAAATDYVTRKEKA